MTWRSWCRRWSGSTAAFLALVMTFSAIGRSALALASVVTMPSAATSDATRFAIMRRWWWASLPNARVLRGVAGTDLLLDPELQATLVELGDHLVEGLLAEVGDGQEVVLGLDEQLADGVDLGALQAVAGALRQVEVLDRQVEVGRAGRDRGDLAELEALGLVAHVAHQLDERGERGAGGGEGLARRDGAVGFDVEHEAVVVRVLL